MAATPSQMRRLSDPPAPLLAVLSNDLLADILIRLPTLADLGRASTVCVAFRRVISDHSFLGRLRALHPLPLLGIMSISFIPAEPPHPCATLARAITPAAAVDFWCSFVPSRDRWDYIDFRDGRVFLAAVPEGRGVRPCDFNPRTLIREFAACDPLHHRYIMLPTIPEYLTALVNQPEIVRFSPFLAPSDEDVGGTSFRVICLVQCQTNLVLFIFSSIGGSWHAAEFDVWRALAAESSNPAPGFLPDLNRPDYAHGCFCWVMDWSHQLLVLDMGTMEFSAVDIPQINPLHRRGIAEAGGGKFGTYTLHFNMEYEYALLYTTLQNDGKGTTSLESEAFIPLPSDYRYIITGVAGGYLLLQGIPENLHSFSTSERPNIDFFSLNLKTFQIEWFCQTQNMIISAPLYVGFPPSLSAPTI
ncbi:hypothetical protein PR202_ga29583 [Eleusine coracana subsp. coracana]|uniref:F-box domain-containing protein n=1 Tax=Eleusine coracana subsp. coracana TaxID=191504 RepID=A0AAV5DME9_ELECO|nr:hypothetical protein QOZ80_7AG0572150 [Eleusine coracana subsp. coracana]GJN11396.1 hypothetical protein PR202_ga29583 [Eleusine coracana subsp. coracana]